MPNFNKTILAGHLTRDPALKNLPNGTPVCEFALAVNDGYKEKKAVYFFDCVLFGKGAEVFNQYMAKGRPVLVEGKLQQRRWEDKQGQKRSKIEVNVREFQFLGGKESDNGDGGAGDSAV